MNDNDLAMGRSFYDGDMSQMDQGNFRNHRDDRSAMSHSMIEYP